MNIKDYLKYYLGQQYRHKSVEWLGWSGWFTLKGADIDAIMHPHMQGLFIQFALRRLEDMTEEEAIELLGITVPYATYHSKDHSGLYWSGAGISSAHLSFSYGDPRSFHFLLFRGFDLFGLCDAGLAIDAKTINTI